MIETKTYLKQPHTMSWWFKSAGVATSWIGAAIALFMTTGASGSGGYDATRFNQAGIVLAGGFLSVAVGFFLASWLTKPENRPVYQDYTADGEGVDYDLVDAR